MLLKVPSENLSEFPPSPYCRFYIVRHGESEANDQGFIAGHLDSPLTSLGEKQAIERAKEFSHIQFGDVFASDLLRAHKTAELLTKEHQLIVKTTERIRERSYGKFEGTPYDLYNAALSELVKEYEELLEEQKLSHRLGGEIESEQELFERLQLFLRELSVAHPGKNILVVCHGGIMREFLLRMGIGERLTPPTLAVKNLGYVVVDSDGTEFIIKKIEGVEERKV